MQDVTALSRDGEFICVAQKSRYHLVNARTKAVLELFPFDPEHTIPIVKRIGECEVRRRGLRHMPIAVQFLLSVWAGGLTMGMFVSNTGSTTRAPIQWPVCPNHVAYRFPYTVAVSASQGLIIVHRHGHAAAEYCLFWRRSVLDQQNKQVMSFKARG